MTHLPPDRLEQVLGWTEEFLAAVAADGPQARLLESALAGLAHTVRGVGPDFCFPVFDLPLGVHAAASGIQTLAVPLAAACGLVFLGLDIFDDLADGDRPEHWSARSPAEINLAAATVLSALPSLLLTRLEASPERRLLLQTILADGLLRMSAGQQADLALAGSRNPSVEAVEASVVGKSGEQYATYCALAAGLAGAPHETIGLYAAFGREIGAACQLASDCHELLVDPACRDLVHGSRTLPLTAHLNRLPENRREAFLDLLDQARTDPEARQEVRQRLLENAEIRRVMFGARVRLERARRLLEKAGALEPGRGWLMEVLDRICAA